jgi:hypothetical protein
MRFQGSLGSTAVVSWDDRIFISLGHKHEGISKEGKAYEGAIHDFEFRT